MREDRSTESVWTSAPNAEPLVALTRLPQAPPSRARAQALEVEARREIAARAAAYRTTVSPETLRRSLW